MSSVDERIVQMKFENAAFERGVQQTLASLVKLNKGLQLEGATKGLVGVATAAQQFDQRMVRSRNSLGQFTTSVSQSSTVTAGFGQKIASSEGPLSKFTSGFSSLVNHVTSFGSKLESGRNSLGQFTGGLASTAAQADKSASSLQKIEGAVSTLAGKFSALGTMATGALMSIGARAAQAGLQLANSFSFAPIMSGFHEYETNLNSIQTILANTQAAGTNLKDVNGALNELNHYADQTIYNFSEMARNIGTFTAAGVGLKESTAAIKGIANLAALSGSNSEQASGAMYQLSQAISAGRVSLEDWNSVVNAGMGGTVFQRALAMNAEKMGTLKDGAVKLKGEMKNVTIGGKSFRESITAKPGQESWLTSKVLTQTLAQFTGDLSNAQLKAQGFSKAQIKAIQDQAKMAKAAATEVKTFSQLMDTTKESIGSGWTSTWQLIFGDFTEAKGLFTGVSKAIGGIVQSSSDARNKMLAQWKKLGGRDALIKGLSNAFSALGSVLKPIKDAFRQIFPATTGKQLADMTKNFRDFTAKLKIGSETADKLKRTFAGVFAIFGIAVDIIKAVVGTIFDLVGVATKGSGGFLDFTAKVGDFIVALRNGIREGNGITNFFKGLGSVLAIPIKLVQKLGHFLGSLFKGTGGDAKAFQKNVAGISSKLDPLAHLGEITSAAWEKTLTVVKNVMDFFSKVGTKISNGLKSIGIDLSSMFEGFDFKTMFAGLNTGLLAGLFLIVKKFLGTFSGDAGGIFDAISEGIGNLTSTFTSMQNALKAATLLQIALAIGVLALSLSILAKINPDDLTKAGAAITVLFGQLLGSLAIFQKFIGTAGFAKLPFVMGSLILLAGAVLILVQAVKQLSGLNWNELAKGLTGLAVTLGLVVGALKYMPNPAGLISTGLGLIALAAGIKILASAVGDLSGLNWNELAKGVVGVGALLGSLILFTKFAKADKGGLAQGAGIILLAAGIKILASALKDIAKMSWAELGEGLAGMAVGLILISDALNMIPPNSILSAASVLIVAASLGLLAKALKSMAKMSWGEIAKSMVVLAGSLIIISAAMLFMTEALPGAAALLVVSYALTILADALAVMGKMGWEEIAKSMVILFGALTLIAAGMILMLVALPGALALYVVAAALKVLTPVLQAFGQMSWEEIAKGLVMLAGVFIIFGAAGLLLAPVIPLMLALGVAVGILGAGLLMAGAGVFLFATGLVALAAAGAGATAAIVGIVGGLIALIPEAMKQIGLGIIAFAKVIEKGGPAITKALVAVLNSLIDAIAQLTPKIVNTLFKLLSKLIDTMLKYVPHMVDAGLKLLTGILNGIAKNLEKVITAATNVVVAFLKGVGKNLPRVIDAGVKLIIDFINGMAKAIRDNTDAMNTAGRNLAGAIIEGMIKGLAGGLGRIASAAANIGKMAISAAKGALDSHSPSKEFIKIGNYVNDGFRKGLDGNKGQIDSAFKSMTNQLKALSKNAKATGSERKKALSAYNELTKKYKDEHAALDKLATSYDKYTEKIKNAKQALVDIKKTRDDFKKSVADQYSVLPDISADTSVANYEADLKTQIEKTKQFANTLQRLRDLGLNDEAYKQLLNKGIDALPFANELLAGGKNAVNEVNSLDSQLAAAAKGLGKSASSALYDAAVHSAEGLVKGLEIQQKRIERQMDKIADAMVKAIKKKLGIKSPSRVFMAVGGYSAEGLIKGLGEMSGSVEKAAAGTGSVAVEALRKSLSGFSDLITTDVGLQPVITPVLDLSSVRKGAGQIGSILPGQSISVDSAFAKARSISEARMTAQEATLSVGDPASKTVNYTQNNFSPKALSSAEIYRQTKNQLSKAKGALT